ncbi:MAG TPA: hypothetical protein VIK18_10945 [Pirellulales bacterium]
MIAADRDRDQVAAAQAGLSDQLCRDERIVRFREVAVGRNPQIASVSLGVEKSRRLAFDDDRSNGAAWSGVCLLAIAAVVAAPAAKLLAVLILPGLVLLRRLGLLLVASALTVAIAVPESAESPTALAAPISASILATSVAFGAAAI